MDNIAPCINESTLVYAENGMVSVTETLIRCLQYINDPLMFPGYFFNASDLPFVVKNMVVLNNLISIKEVDNSAELDIYFRLYWQDPRLNMPALWSALQDINPILGSMGIDVSQLLGVQDVLSSQVPSVWLPDIFFPEAIETNLGDHFLKLHPNGTMEWSRHLQMKLIQSQFDYRKYPMDEQFIMLRFFSYGLNSSLLVQEFYDPVAPVSLFANYKGTPTFTENAIWTYQRCPGEIVLEVNGYGRVRSAVHDFCYISRQSTGVTMRLGVPILLMVILAVFTFWASMETRSDSTVTILLAVSALYIVVFQSVPMLGYLTVFDSFVLVMFFMLFIVCLIHQSVFRLSGKLDENPCRLLVVRLMESFSRILLLPIVMSVFLVCFAPSYNPGVVALCASCTAIFTGFVTTRELAGLRKTYTLMTELLATKIAFFDKATVIEKLIFNIYYYGKISTSVRHYRESAQENINHGSNVTTTAVETTISHEPQRKSKIVESSNHNWDRSRNRGGSSGKTSATTEMDYRGSLGMEMSVKSIRDRSISASAQQQQQQQQQQSVVRNPAVSLQRSDSDDEVA
jgi:hypothetical protein